MFYNLVRSFPKVTKEWLKCGIAVPFTKFDFTDSDFIVSNIVKLGRVPLYNTNHSVSAVNKHTCIKSHTH